MKDKLKELFTLYVKFQIAVFIIIMLGTFFVAVSKDKY